MKPRESPLVRHLALAIAVKLALLAALWWVFVRVDRVSVDAESASAHLADPAAPAVPIGAHP
jgi:hypothetical protein